MQKLSTLFEKWYIFQDGAGNALTTRKLKCASAHLPVTLLIYTEGGGYAVYNLVWLHQ